MSEFNLVQAVFDRSALSLTEDVAVCTMHIRKHIAFAPDVGPITDTERNDFTAKFTTFFNAIKGNISAAIKLQELRYYDVPSGPGRAARPSGGCGCAQSRSAEPPTADDVDDVVDLHH